MDKRKKRAILSAIGTCIVLSALSFKNNYHRDAYKNGNMYLSSLSICGQSVDLNKEDYHVVEWVSYDEPQGTIEAEPVDGWYIDKILTMQLENDYNVHDIRDNNNWQCTEVENGGTIDFGEYGSFTYIYLKKDKGFGQAYSMLHITPVETLEIDTTDWVKGETKITLHYEDIVNREINTKYTREISYGGKSSDPEVRVIDSPEEFITVLYTDYGVVPTDACEVRTEGDITHTIVEYREENGKYYVPVYKNSAVSMEVI